MAEGHKGIFASCTQIHPWHLPQVPDFVTFRSRKWWPIRRVPLDSNVIAANDPVLRTDGNVGR